MRRIIGAFKNPASRPRAIIWSGVALVGIVMFSAVSVIGTSVNWFCTDPCHVVHLDNTKTFEAGSHVQVNCVSCHEPVNANPLVFVWKKLEVAPDLIPTIMGTFDLPMNKGSYVAVEMPDIMCTQCHALENRDVTPSSGIIIDHTAHSSQGVTCATCHNRVAHPEENVEYTLPGDEKHENWMTMDACFRCHTLSGESESKTPATGKCAACHPAEFELVPTTHAADGWYTRFGASNGHADAAKAEASQTAEAMAAEPLELKHAVGPVLQTAASVNNCYTCHLETFCSDCHGLSMPHPADFRKTHSEQGLSKPEVCAPCHARSAAEAKDRAFCNACHHPDSKPGVLWRTQHDDVVKSKGIGECFDCHGAMYCEACHVRGPAAAEKYLRDN
jgi:nitrate/TMAO reductase-like tetraheme cytochrome c subunit